MKKWDRCDVKCVPVQFLAWTQRSCQMSHEACTHVCMCVYVFVFYGISLKEKGLGLTKEINKTEILI